MKVMFGLFSYGGEINKNDRVSKSTRINFDSTFNA